MKINNKEISIALSKCELFNDVSLKLCEDFAKITKSKELKKGEILFEQGAPSENLYVLIKGKIKIYKLSFSGREQTLRIIQKPSSFAEVPIFTNGPYPAFAEAIEDSIVVMFPRKTLINKMYISKQFVNNVIRTLANRLQYMGQLVEKLSLFEVSGRLAAFLLNEMQSSGNPFTLKCSKAQLAAILGTIGETLSRTFMKLKKENIVEINSNEITVLDEDSLQELADGLRKL